MQFTVALLTNTPAWVYLMLAYLLWQGWQASRPRMVPVWRVLVVPSIFLTLGLSTLVLRHADGAWPAVAWLAAGLALAPLGYTTGPRPRLLDAARRQVSLPGSPIPLVRNVIVFALQYGFAVTAALHPDEHAQLAIVGRAVSGATAGYFIGWGIAFWRHYRDAARSDAILATPA